MSRFESFRLNAISRPFRFQATVVTLGLLLALNPQLASANSILTYTGNNYTNFSQLPCSTCSHLYTTSEFVSVQLELATELGADFSGYVSPIKYTFSDGRSTITDLSLSSNIVGPDTLFWFQSDSGGNVAKWQVIAATHPGPLSYLEYIGTVSGLPYPGAFVDRGGIQGEGLIEFGRNFNLPGTWLASTAAIPEPETYPMLLAGLGLLGFAARRRKLKLAG